MTAMRVARLRRHVPANADACAAMSSLYLELEGACNLMTTQTTTPAPQKSSGYAYFAGTLLVILLTFGILHSFGVFR
jgi:hypothetical protein